MLERVFHLSELGTTVRTEILGGTTTFLTMAYIIFGNAYIESATGVQAGARTGLANVATGAFFLLALFFSPVVRMVGGGVPVEGGNVLQPMTAPALIVVGCLIARNVTGCCSSRDIFFCDRHETHGRHTGSAASELRRMPQSNDPPVGGSSTSDTASPTRRWATHREGS